MLHHYSQKTDFVSVFKYLGIPIVACFFLMSGYGLMTSYLKKGSAYMEHFLLHRFKAVLIPYLVTLLFCVVYKTIKNDIDIWQYFSDKPFEQFVPHTWFVWVLVGGYVIFKVIFSSKIDIRQKIALFALCSLCYYIIGILSGLPKFWYFSSPAMLLGMIWRYKENAIMKFIDGHICLFPVLPILVSAIPMLLFHVKNFFPISACLFFMWFAYLCREGWCNNKITKFLGGISYEVYLCHGILVGIMVGLSNSDTLNFILLIIATVIFSVLVNKVSNLIKRVL